ncbi:MAG: sortase [Bacilli bacterium]
MQKTKKNVIIGYLVMAISIGLLLLNYLSTKKDKVFNDINLEYYSLTNPVLEVKKEDIKEEEVIPEKEQEELNYSNYFIGSLEIPKIGLNRGFVDINSLDNDVSKNISIIKSSDMPDVELGNFILAAHSGNSYISFFKDLYLINNGDSIYINYKGKKYTYQITNIYLQEKTGKIGIYRDQSKTTVTLVTCTKDDEQHQTIYIADLVSIN